jgi:hypothetical protein
MSDKTLPNLPLQREGAKENVRLVASQPSLASLIFPPVEKRGIQGGDEPLPHPPLKKGREK